MSGTPAVSQAREAAKSLLMDQGAASLAALAETVETTAQVGATSPLRIAKYAREALILRPQHRLAAMSVMMATMAMIEEMWTIQKFQVADDLKVKMKRSVIACSKILPL